MRSASTSVPLPGDPVDTSRPRRSANCRIPDDAVVTTASSGIRQFADLRGRLVSTGSPGSGTEVLALRMLRAAGLDPDRDVRRQGLGATESADALKDGKIEAFFWGGGVPTPALQDLSHTPGMAIRLIPSGQIVPALQKEFGGVYFEAGVPAGVYPGVTETVSMVASHNVLVVNAAMDESLAYDIVRTMFEQRQELGDIHPEARKLSLETAVSASPAPFHPGAIRYYREKGAWKK